MSVFFTCWEVLADGSGVEKLVLSTRVFHVSYPDFGGGLTWFSAPATVQNTWATKVWAHIFSVWFVWSILARLLKEMRITGSPCVCVHTHSLLCLPLFPITYEPLPQFDKGGVIGNYNFMKMSPRYRYEWPVWRRLKEKLVYGTSGNQKEREVMDALATWKALIQACPFWNTRESNHKK